jgi:hypothetical protein
MGIGRIAFMDPGLDDQQPIARTVGRRTQAPLGTPPTAEARAAWSAMAAMRTRAPKGVFRYDSHAEMSRDREAWAVAAVIAHRLRRA